MGQAWGRHSHGEVLEVQLRACALMSIMHTTFCNNILLVVILPLYDLSTVGYCQHGPVHRGSQGTDFTTEIGSGNLRSVHYKIQ